MMRREEYSTRVGLSQARGWSMAGLKGCSCSMSTRHNAATVLGYGAGSNGALDAPRADLSTRRLQSCRAHCGGDGWSVALE